MTITEAMHDLSCDPLAGTDREFLDKNGYLLVPGIIDPDWLEALREQFEAMCAAEGSAAGLEVHQEAGARRLSDLVNKGAEFDRVYTHPRVLAGIYHVIGRDFKLSSLNARDALPGEGNQDLHTDWGQPRKGNSFNVCNSVWLLDDFTDDNGATRVVPGTHVDTPQPGEVLEDPAATHPDEVKLIAPAGTVVIFNSHLWHGGTKNVTGDQLRRAIHCYFTAREYPQQLNQRQYLRPETWKRLSPAARYILDVDLEI
jgi:ectoine hydroxylase-related dioxygenase (phytanoyl-CoA dioxygenase family)